MPTSDKVASDAGKVLADPKSTAKEKELAAAVLAEHKKKQGK
jgi:hypothetical protein